MRNRSLTPFAIVLALLSICFACGEDAPPPPPEDVPAEDPATEASDSPHWATGDEGSMLPADHDATEMPALSSWKGDVVLRGELAAATEGIIFMLVSSSDGGMTGVVRKIDVSSPDLPAAADGVRRIPFDIDSPRGVGGFPPSVEAVEIQARFDPDGFAETSEGNVTGYVFAELTAEGLEIVLE